MIRGLGQLFGKKLEKVPDFPKKHEKSTIWPKLAIFSSKLPWFGVWVNFSAESFKKCLISRKGTKNCLLVKSCKFWSKLPWFGVYVNFSTKIWKKNPDFTIKHEKSSFWPKLQVFGASYHGSAFGSTVRQKVAKST